MASAFTVTRNASAPTDIAPTRSRSYTSSTARGCGRDDEVASGFGRVTPGPRTVPFAAKYRRKKGRRRGAGAVDRGLCRIQRPAGTRAGEFWLMLLSMVRGGRSCHELGVRKNRFSLILRIHESSASVRRDEKRLVRSYYTEYMEYVLS